MRMRWALLSIAVVGIVASIIYTVQALRYSWVSGGELGRGAWPAIIGILMLVAALAIGVESRDATSQINLSQRVAVWRIPMIVGGCFLYIVLLPYLGQAVSGAMVSFLALQAMDRMRWPVKVGIGVAMSLGCYFLFDVVLNVPMPRGIWFR